MKRFKQTLIDIIETIYCNCLKWFGIFAIQDWISKRRSTTVEIKSSSFEDHLLKDVDGKVVAQEADLHPEYCPPENFKRFVAYLHYGEEGDQDNIPCIEEIDIDAVDEEYAHVLASVMATTEYQEGITKIKVERKFGMYI